MDSTVVNFEFGKYYLDPFAQGKIDRFLMGDSIVRIRISAHCDSFGSNAYNATLSLKRAREVQQFLLNRNFRTIPIEILAKGEDAPLNTNENAKARAANRRAEIILVRQLPQAANTFLNSGESENELQPESFEEARPDSAYLFNGNDTTSINLENVEIGTSFRLANLNFYGGRHDLLPKSFKALEQLLNTLKANPNLEIQIQGHICCLQSGDGRDIGDGTNNLSVNRAKAVYDYLIKNGINKKRLSYIGFGSQYKLVPEITEEDLSTNRRVEIKVVKK